MSWGMPSDFWLPPGGHSALSCPESAVSWSHACACSHVAACGLVFHLLLLHWPKPSWASAETAGGMEKGTDTGRCGYRAVAVTILIQQTSRMGKDFLTFWAFKGCSLVSQSIPFLPGGHRGGAGGGQLGDGGTEAADLLASSGPIRVGDKGPWGSCWRMDCQSRCPCTWGEKPPFFDLQKQAWARQGQTLTSSPLPCQLLWAWAAFPRVETLDQAAFQAPVSPSAEGGVILPSMVGARTMLGRGCSQL